MIIDELSVGDAVEEGVKIEEPQALDKQDELQVDASVFAPQDHSSASDIAVSRDHYQRMLLDATMHNASKAELKLPWEQGVLSVICGTGDLHFMNNTLDSPVVPAGFSGLPNIAQSSQEVSSSKKRPLTLPLYASAVKALRDEDAFEELGRLWNVAVGKWLANFELMGYPGTIGNLLWGSRDDSVACFDILRDVLGIRSPRTAIKRARTVHKFLQWLGTCNVSFADVTRVHVLTYLTGSEDRAVAASTGTSLMECFRFLKFVMTISIPGDILEDAQIAGRVQRLRVTQADYKPARDLMLCEVTMLERSMTVLTDQHDVYILGCCIFALYSRSRWSDLKHIQHLWCEKYTTENGLFGFVEARTRFHKTGTSMEKKLRFMPLVAPVAGATDLDWTELWFSAMDSIGFDHAARPVGALCRAPLTTGGLSSRSLSSEEVNEFLNRVLNTDVTSHSLKHTTLGWAAKYGLSEPVRTLLGHHELPGKSYAVYSR